MTSATPDPAAHSEGRPATLAAAAESLRLDRALQLLRQAGHEPPAGDVRQASWLQAVIDGLCDLSSRDALTNLPNRRTFDAVVAREIDRVARAGEPVLLLMIDVDHFKRVNDTFGHAAGDVVLKAVAEVLQDSCRPMDTVARLGGEEFAMVLPNCSPSFGHLVAERVRERIAERAMEVAPGQVINITVSVGGAFAPQWVRTSGRMWLERADQQLYTAKAQGRNRTCIEATPLSPVTPEERVLLFSTSAFQDLE